MIQLTIPRPSSEKVAEWVKNPATGIGIALFLLVFLVDLFVLPRHILNYRDSLEMVTASHLFQSAHPPGFPIFIVLGKILTSCLFWIESVYTRYAVVNSLYGAGAIVFLYSSGLILTRRPVLSGLCSLGLAFSYTFWLYRIVPEAFMLANLASMASLWLLLKWRESYHSEGVKTTRLWNGFALSVGLALVCHQITTLWWVGFLWIVVTTAKKESPKLILRAIPYFLLGLTPFLMVIVFAALPHQPLWGNGLGFQTIKDYLLRVDYGGLGNPGMIGRQDTGLGWDSMQSFLAHADANFSMLAMIGLAGLALFYHKDRVLGFLPVTLLMAGPVFIIYARFRTDSPFYLGSAEPNYIPCFIALVLTGMVLMGWLLDSVKKPKFNLGVMVALSLLILVNLVYNFPRVDRRENTLSSVYTNSLFEHIANGGVLVVSEDRDIFGAIYATWVAKVRPDVAIISYGFLHKPAYREELKRAYPDLQVTSALTPSVFMRQFLRENYGKRPIYLATARHSNLWGCVGNPFFLRPRGKVFEVVKDSSIIAKDQPFLPFYNELTMPYSAVDFWDQDLINGFRISWRNQGAIYTQLGLYSRAAAIYKQLAEIDPYDPEWKEALARLEKREDAFQKDKLKPTDHIRFEKSALAKIRLGKLEDAIYDLEIAISLAPNIALYQDQMAVLLASQRDFESALPYVKRALELAPGNQKYLQDLLYIQDKLGKNKL